MSRERAEPPRACPNPASLDARRADHPRRAPAPPPLDQCRGCCPLLVSCRLLVSDRLAALSALRAIRQAPSASPAAVSSLTVAVSSPTAVAGYNPVASTATRLSDTPATGADAHRLTAPIARVSAAGAPDAPSPHDAAHTVHAAALLRPWLRYALCAAIVRADALRRRQADARGGSAHSPLQGRARPAAIGGLNCLGARRALSPSHTVA